MSPRLPTRQWCAEYPDDAAQILRLAIGELFELRAFAEPKRLSALRRRERDLLRRLAEIEEAMP